MATRMLPVQARKSYKLCIHRRYLLHRQFSTTITMCVALLQNGITASTPRKLDPFQALEMRLKQQHKAADADLNKNL